MRLTEAERYAIEAMGYIAGKGKGVLVSRKEVSENAGKEGIPTHFLAKIAQDLSKALYIEIRQGSRGGFVLTCDPWKVSLYDIVHSMTGALDIGFKFDDDSKLGRAINKVNDDLVDHLDIVTLGEVVEDGQG